MQSGPFHFLGPARLLIDKDDPDAAGGGLCGQTDVGGILEEKVPVCGVMEDSNGALFAEGCFRPGMDEETRTRKREGWQTAVKQCLNHA